MLGEIVGLRFTVGLAAAGTIVATLTLLFSPLVGIAHGLRAQDLQRSVQLPVAR
jgi:hypothetical protein